MKLFNYLLLTLFVINCTSNAVADKEITDKEEQKIPVNIIDTATPVIHVFVALCDNKFQGIVPVKEKIGNGQEPATNLYWGWGYGVKTYFKNSKEWAFIKSEKQTYPILERLLFKSTSSEYYLVADAYDGRNMKECITGYLESTAGILNDTIVQGGKIIGINGNSRLLAFIGHNGLMDFTLTQSFINRDKRKRDCIILACYSKSYFTPFLKQAEANPVLWTTNLMGPEAYTIHDALTGYIKTESNENIRSRAAKAYSKYTLCSETSAKKLLVTGW